MEPINSINKRNRTVYRDLSGEETPPRELYDLWTIEGLDLWKIEPIVLDFPSRLADNWEGGALEKTLGFENRALLHSVKI